jgi:hypothetical protein
MSSRSQLRHEFLSLTHQLESDPGLAAHLNEVAASQGFAAGATALTVEPFAFADRREFDLQDFVAPLQTLLSALQAREQSGDTSFRLMSRELVLLRSQLSLDAVVDPESVAELLGEAADAIRVALQTEVAQGIQDPALLQAAFTLHDRYRVFCNRGKRSFSCETVTIQLIGDTTELPRAQEVAFEAIQGIRDDLARDLEPRCGSPIAAPLTVGRQGKESVHYLPMAHCPNQQLLELLRQDIRTLSMKLRQFGESGAAAAFLDDVLSEFPESLLEFHTSGRTVLIQQLLTEVIVEFDHADTFRQAEFVFARKCIALLQRQLETVESVVEQQKTVGLHSILVPMYGEKKLVEMARSEIKAAVANALRPLARALAAQHQLSFYPTPEGWLIFQPSEAGNSASLDEAVR